MTRLPIVDRIQDVLLFAGLTLEQLSFIERKLHHKTFPMGHIIVNADQPGEALYIILQGTVKIFVNQADGKQVIFALLGSGEVFGEMSLVEQVDRAADVMTLDRSEVLWMDRYTFQECLKTIPEMSLNLTRIISRRLRLANAHIQSLASDDVYGRIAHLLLAFASEYGQKSLNGDIHISLRLTQSDLASLAGASRVHISRVLNQYRQLGYISMRRSSYITIHNVAAIKDRRM